MAGLRDIRGQFVLDGITVLTASGAYAMANDQGVVKSFAGTLALTLPASPIVGRLVIVKDGEGDAGTDNITISGAGSDTIDGSSNLVMSTNYGAKMLMWNGTEWSVVSSS